MLASLLLISVCICFIFILVRPRRPKNFPPGPTPLPLLGNLLNFGLEGPLKYSEKLRKSHGNVFSFFIGHRPVVLVNGLKAVREALVNKAVDFAGRPQNLLMNDILENRGIIITDYGPTWKEQRRFALMTFRNFGMGKQSMQERILEELQHTINYLKKSTGQTVNPQVMFHAIASNVVFRVLYNKRYEQDDEFMIKFFSYCVKLSTTFGPWSFLYNSFRWVRSLPLPFKKAFEAKQAIIEILIPIINEHKRTRVPGEPRDFTDCYLDELDKRGNDGSSFCVDELLIISAVLYGAGTDTTSNTLRTAFLYLSNRPHIQERCQQEIDQVLKGKDFVSFEDRRNMPYVQAVISECLRIAGTVPFGIYHQTTTDTELMGYSIPKSTIVITNLTSVLWEEGQWKFPQEFNPENFLNDKGEFVKPDAFMPFSVGPRICLGEGLARMELFLIIVTLLSKFRFSWPQDAGQPDYELLFGLSMRPKPYQMKVELRVQK